MYYMTDSFSQFFFIIWTASKATKLAPLTSTDSDTPIDSTPVCTPTESDIPTLTYLPGMKPAFAPSAQLIQLPYALEVHADTVVCHVPGLLKGEDHQASETLLGCTSLICI